METIEVTRRDGIVTVMLNRPHKKNAMTPTMWEELLDVFGEVEGNRDDRVLVITGAEDAFCSGADLTDSSGNESAADGVGGSVERMRLVTRCALALHELRTPTLAAVNGVAAGAGASLARASGRAPGRRSRGGGASPGTTGASSSWASPGACCQTITAAPTSAAAAALAS